MTLSLSSVFLSFSTSLSRTLALIISLHYFSSSFSVSFSSLISSLSLSHSCGKNGIVFLLFFSIFQIFAPSLKEHSDRDERELSFWVIFSACSSLSSALFLCLPLLSSLNLSSFVSLLTSISFFQISLLKNDVLSPSSPLYIIIQSPITFTYHNEQLRDDCRLS